MRRKVFLKSLVLFIFASILTSCGGSSDNVNPPSNSINTNTTQTSDATIIPGVTECDSAGDLSPGGKYVCAGRGMFYWVLLQDLATDSVEVEENNSNDGYWATNCVTVEKPNPNYNPYKGFSAVVNEPTIRTQECSQVWVQN